MVSMVLTNEAAPDTLMDPTLSLTLSPNAGSRSSAIVTDTEDSRPEEPIATSTVSEAVSQPPIMDSRIPANIKHILAPDEQTRDVKIENCIGFMRIPLGLAGPLTIHGENQKTTTPLFAPLATLEATLVASTSRGCKLLELCGGVSAVALSETMSRAPSFRFKTVDHALAFYRRVPEFEAQFRVDAEKTSKHCRLTGLEPHIVGTSVHVKFAYSCGDAAGQNMVTIATHAACSAFLKSPLALQSRVVGFQIEAQLSSDKKASTSSIHKGRGVQVLAWAVVTDAACKSVLGASTSEVHQAMRIGQEGGIRAGLFGCNVNTANIIAAMFTACGQDCGSVFEAGFTHLTHEYDNETKDLTVSLYIPCLTVGTVGGGTAYPTQREALELINCFGPGRKWALAETIAAFALALDLSTVGAVANDTFARAHQRLARGGIGAGHGGLAQL